MDDIKQETINEFKTTRARVIRLLTNEERCRNDDQYLTYRVLEEISRENGEGIYISFKLFRKFPAFETIKRTRAKLNANGEYLPTDPNVIKKRRIRQQTISALMAG